MTKIWSVGIISPEWLEVKLLLYTKKEHILGDPKVPMRYPVVANTLPQRSLRSELGLKKWVADVLLFFGYLEIF